MPEPIVDKIIRQLDVVTELYHRLILLVSPYSGGKTTSLQNVAEHTQHPIININLELSRRMLDLTERQRILKIPRIMEEVVNIPDSDVILLDNLEILFDVSLKQDPLRLLQRISRNRSVIAAWNGNIQDKYLIYAVPDHPEYRRYPLAEASEFLVIEMQGCD